MKAGLFVRIIALGTVFFASPAFAREPMKAVAIGNPASWFSSDDYPPEAIRAARQGRSVIDVGVDSAGKGVSCSVRLTSGTDILDTTACKLALEKGLFNPARDKFGETEAGVVTLPVVWTLPDRPKVEPIEDFMVHRSQAIEYRISEEGKMISCRVVESHLPPDAANGCKGFEAGRQYGTRWTKGAQPVAATVKMTQTFQVTVDR